MSVFSNVITPQGLEPLQFPTKFRSHSVIRPNRKHVSTVASPDRRAALRAVRTVIRKNLPAGYKEAMNWGMITYQVPLRTFPDTYNGRPLMYAALASQKNYMVVYLTGIYTSPAKYEAFKRAYKTTGKRWDVGKSCVRFRALDDLPLELIGTTIASIPLDAFAKQFTIGRATRSKRSSR